MADLGLGLLLALVLQDGGASPPPVAAWWAALPRAVERDPVIAIQPAGAWTLSGAIYGRDGRQATIVEGQGFRDPHATAAGGHVLVGDVQDVPHSETDRGQGIISLYTSAGGRPWRRAVRPSGNSGSSVGRVVVKDGTTFVGIGKYEGCVRAEGGGARTCSDGELAMKHEMCSDDTDLDTCMESYTVEYNEKGKLLGFRAYPGAPGDVTVGARGEIGFFGAFHHSVDLDVGAGRAEVRSAAHAPDDDKQGFFTVADPKGKWRWGRALVGDRSISVSELAFDEEGDVWVLAEVGEAPGHQRAAVRLTDGGQDRRITDEPCGLNLLLRLAADGRYLSHQQSCGRAGPWGLWPAAGGGVLVAGPWLVRPDTPRAFGVVRPDRAPAEDVGLSWVRDGKSLWSLRLQDLSFRALYSDAAGTVCVALNFQGERTLPAAAGGTNKVGDVRSWTTLAGCLPARPGPAPAR
jgi:hypothetical protein